MSATVAPFGIFINRMASSGASSSRRSDRSSQSAPCQPITGAIRRPEIGCTPGCCADVGNDKSATSALGIRHARIARRIRLRITAMTEPTLTPSRLWKSLTFDQRQRVARAFWQDEEASDDQVSAALLIAQQK